MMKFNKFLAFVLSFALLISLFPAIAVTASAAETTNVAKIGETEYGSLQAAINAATPGATITLIADVNQPVNISKNLTINGGDSDHKFEYTGTMTLNAAVDFTVENVNFANGTIVKPKGTAQGGTYTIKGCDFEGQNLMSYAIDLRSTYKIIIEDSSAKGYAGFVQVPNSNSGVSVKNVVVDALYYGFKIDYSGTGDAVIMENVTVNAGEYALYHSNYGEKTHVIKNCTLNGGVEGIALWNRKTGLVNTFRFEGNNTVSSMTNSQYAKYVLAAGASLTTPEGVTVTTNAEGYDVKYKNGAYSAVKHVDAVVMIDETPYESLAAAIAEANAGDTITFLADITEDATISKAITIDGAGKTYTGKMTLKADTTIKNVNFDGNGYNGYAVETRGAQYVTIEACTVKNYGYGFVQLASATALTTVKNVTVSNVNYGVKVDYSNAVVIENSDITAGVAAVLNSNYGEKIITIKDSKLNIIGTYTRNNTTETAYVFEGANTVSQFIIEEALDSFKLAAGATLTAPEAVTVTTVDGYEVKYENGTYTSVVKPNDVVTIGTQGYATLADALAAAQAGQTITFLADINENVTINKAVTIDGAGKTYTGAMELKADTTIKNVNFDGKGYNGYAITTRGANYLTMVDCTAKNYGYGFVQLASATALTTVKNVTASNMNYGVKVDYSGAVVLENVNFTAGVAAVLNSNYGEKTITIKNSELNILGTWTRNNTIKTKYVFEGENSIDQFKTDAAIDTFELAAGATLTAPKEITVTTDVEGFSVTYAGGAYKLVSAPVAKVGTKTYTTLQKAIDACNPGGKVTLLRNAKGPGVVINKNITINFANYTYTFTEGVGSTGTASNGLQILAGNKVTLSAGTLMVAEEAADKFYILVQNYADLSCFNMNLDGTYLDKWSKTDGDSYVLSNNSGYISLTGKTYITTNDDGDKAFAFDACDSKYYADKPVVFAASTVKINGKAISESYDKIEAAARIGSTQFFASLKEAFAYASSGNTIKLMADIAVSEGITNTKKVTLDLNGKTITGTDNATGSFAIITNKGQLTIIGNGTITLTATNNRGWSAYSSIISNTVGGKLIVESGTIEHLGGTDMAYGIDNLTNGKGTYAETIINGGTIKSTYRAIRMFLNGVEAQNILTINGGVVEGANKSVWMQDPSKNANTGKITVAEGATLNGDVYLTVTAGSTEWPVEVSIAASAVNGEVLTSNVPESYKLINTNGVYSVEKVEKVKTYIAQVGVKKYESLQAAIDACPGGGKVTLLCDAKGPGVVINKNITILFKGYTYTITEPVGSAGTETLGFQILKGNTVVLNNGKIEIAEEAADKFAILIQNYANLTVYQMILDGTNLGRYENYSYVLSVNCGKVTVNGKSVLTAKDGEGNYALDVYDYSSAGYSLPTVTVTSVVKINGKISAGAKYSTVYYATVEQAKAATGKNVSPLN